ncbi:hypothetical protein KFK09_012582 [Dendrobium nobile]|uniref:Uncharacterized protein n=1 Tax=Dendrobium nobile TaxID=94219 RepID=A0A8T3BL86_DENNO|nr:hypothetical protein KFK09_012582 [Dendrobium nobile]
MSFLSSHIQWKFIGLHPHLFSGRKGKMNSLPIYPRDEGWSCDEACYDPCENFALILKEARKHEFEAKFHSSPAKTDDVETRKGKKSWKRSLSFLWRKSDKKSSAQKEEHGRTNGSHSGPITGGKAAASSHLRRSIRKPASGPLASWFAQTKEEEAETPYMCLGSRNYSSCSHAFGPIYLVT